MIGAGTCTKECWYVKDMRYAMDCYVSYTDMDLFSTLIGAQHIKSRKIRVVRRGVGAKTCGSLEGMLLP